MIRYANIDFANVKLPNSNMLQVNMGDNLQFLAIDYLYECAGVNSNDVARITMSEIKRGNENPKYRDDFLLLPMNWGIWDKAYMTENNLDVSDNIRIIPLGMCIGGTDGEAFYNEHNKNYYKSISPMGCRDEYSMLKMQKLGINSYLNGCLTSLFPRLKNYNENGKVLFVDAPEELRPFVPKEYLENATFMTQQCYLPADMSCEEINNQVRKHYEKIKREARLVVTSRLHVASPCMAWGIPVIFAKKVVDHRFGWLDKYLPLYSEEDYANIDWEPQPVEYEKNKQELLNFNIKRITDAYYMYSSAEKITKYYGAPIKRKTYPSFRDVVAYDNKAVYEWLSKRFSTDDVFSYVLWGVTDAASEVYRKVSELYPYAKLAAVVDKYKETEFLGYKIQKPDVLQKLKDAIVIVLPVKASGEARELLRSLGYDKEQYFLRGDLYMES